MKRFYRAYSRCKPYGPLLLLILACCNTEALTAQTKGMVLGTVTDEESGNPLPGALIKITDMYTGSVTNLYGEYDFVLSEGRYNMEYSFLGNKASQRTVDIGVGEMTILDVALDPDITQLDDFLVSATLEGQMRALNQQRSASNIQNVVAADQIGKFPDQNAAEALQRVPGINIERDEGDGRFVLIRGLAPQFSNIRINGQQIPSPEAGARFVALDAIPATELASLEVVKAITPDMDGDAIGGSVNLITGLAEKEKLSVWGSFSGEHNTGAGRTTGQGNLSISQRLAEGKFGYLISGTYASSIKGSDRFEMDGWDGDHPDGLDEFVIGDYIIDRDRIGARATLDYHFNPKNKIYFQTLYSELRELEQRREVLNVAEEDEGELTFATEKELKHRQENQGVYSFKLGGNYISPKLKMDYSASYSKAFQKTPFNDKIIYENAEDVSWGVNIADRFNPKLVNYTFDGSPSSFGNSDNYVFSQGETSISTAGDENIILNIDLALPIGQGNTSGEIKFGAKTRMKEKYFRYDNFEEFELADGVEDLTLTQFQSSYTDNNFMDGDLGEAIGYFPDHDRFFDYLATNASDFDIDGDIIDEESALETYEASEDTYAGYVQSKLQFQKLMVLGGVRYEFNQVSYQNFYWDADAAQSIRQDNSNQFGYLLPMLHLRYSINKFINIRGAITRSYARPNFEDLAQGAEISADDNEAFISNPELKPVEAWNFDLLIEKYFGNVGLVSAGVFHKSLNNFIYQQTNQGDLLSFTGLDITQSINGDQATLTGVEVAYQQNLTFLPGFLKGFSVYGNYTYTASNAEVQNFAQGEDFTSIDLPGQSDYFGNVALSYGFGGFNARASMNFNGSYISEIDGGDLIRIDDRKQLDVSASQSFLDEKLTAFVQFNNLLDDRQTELFNSRTTPKEIHRFGFWGRLGAKFNF